MLLIFDLDGTLFRAKPVVQRAGTDASLPGYPRSLREAIRECGELFPGVREMVAQLHGAGHELVVCSMSSPEYIGLVLEMTGIARFFTRYYSSVDYPSKADVVRELITPGEPAVVIGDTHGDITAASENGLPSIAAMYGYGNKSMLAHADSFAGAPEDIVECVAKMLVSRFPTTIF